MQDGTNLFYLAVKHNLVENDLVAFATKDESKYHVFYPEGIETPFVASEMVYGLLRDFGLAYPLQTARQVVKNS